jgi:type IV pilus assembly protein PilO
VTGDYLKVAHFINDMERSQLLFIIDKITLSSQEGGKVSLQITFDTFLKQAA